MRFNFQRGTKIALAVMGVIGLLAFLAGMALLLIAITRFSALYS